MKNRKTLIVGMALVGVMSLAGAAMAFTPDSAAVPAPVQAALQVERPLLVQDGEEVAPDGEGEAPQQEGRRGGQGIIDRDAVHAAVADALGLTVEELEAARDEGQSIADLAEAAGVTIEELEAVQQAVREELVNQAVADGLITAEEGEQILNGEGRQGRRGNGRGNGSQGFSGVIDREAMMADVAEALGISDEQLTAAQEEGLKLSELAEELGISPEEVEAAKDAAKEAAVNQAVEDGVITAEEAEQILNGEGRRGGPRGGNNNGFDGTPDGQIGVEGNNA